MGQVSAATPTQFNEWPWQFQLPAENLVSQPVLTPEAPSAQTKEPF